jgi:hypothetical protein
MTAIIDDRRGAIAAADGTCPRCGSARAPDQRYCLECGLQLPAVTGTLPRLRRGWIRRFGWYPGDSVWVTLVTLAVAAAGTASAIVITKHRDSGPKTLIAIASVPVVEPTAVPTATTRAPAVGNTATLPQAPEQGTAAPGRTSRGPRNGRTVWPKGANGWTIVLVSYPKVNGRPSALATADKAAKAGLPRVGILDSGGFASLQPGYFVVFTGIYGSKSDADAAVSTTRQAGFGGAYSRQIAR